MSMDGIHGDVLREPAIGLAAQVPHRRRILAFASVDSRVHEHPATQQFFGHTMTHLDDNAGDIPTLNARKIKRTQPAGLRRGIFPTTHMLPGASKCLCC